MFGRGAELARSMQSPLSLAYPSILTLYAGQGINMRTPDPKARPALFTFLMGGAGDGKSLVMQRAQQVLGYTHEHVDTSVIVSDRGLVNACREGLDRKDPPGDLRAVCFMTDEGISMLNKMAISGSTLAQTLCEVWSRDRFGAKDKLGSCNANARVSMLANLKLANREEFQKRFSANTQDGFADRPIYCPGPEVRWIFDWEWEPPVQRKKNDLVSFGLENGPEFLDESEYIDVYEPIKPILPKGTVTIPKARWGEHAAWIDAYRAKGIDPGRNAENGLRVAVISASLNGDSEVSEECMAAALRFAEWQMKVREHYAPGEGENPEAVLTGIVLRAFAECHAAANSTKPWMDSGQPVCKRGYINLRRISRKKGWSEKYGPMLARVINSLVATGELEQYEDEPEGKGMRGRKSADYRLVIDHPAPAAADFPTEAAEPQVAA